MLPVLFDNDCSASVLVLSGLFIYLIFGFWLCCCLENISRFVIIFLSLHVFGGFFCFPLLVQMLALFFINKIPFAAIKKNEYLKQIRGLELMV